MKTNSRHDAAIAGFTLPELLIASLVASLTLAALMVTYIQGTRFLKTGITLSMEQHRLDSAMEDIAEVVRPASWVGIRTVTSFPPTPYYYPSTYTNRTGNCLMVMGSYVIVNDDFTVRTNAGGQVATQYRTSMFCQINDVVYYAPDAFKFNTATNYYVIAAGTLPRPDMFVSHTNSVLVRLAFLDTVDTNKIVIEARSGISNNYIAISPRNNRNRL